MIFLIFEFLLLLSCFHMILSVTKSNSMFYWSWLQLEASPSGFQSKQREFRKSFRIRDTVKKNYNPLGESRIYVWTILSDSDLGRCLDASLCTRYILVTAQGKYSLISSGLQIPVWYSHRIWFMITSSRQVGWPKTLFTKAGFKQGGREDCQEKEQRDLEKRKILKANVWEPSWETLQPKFH